MSPESLPTTTGSLSRPRLLDLFCGAGGCSKGFVAAGFDAVGVDINPQPNYPYDFIQGDALELLKALLDGDAIGPSRDGRYYQLEDFVAIHASPPCQDYSKAMRHLADPKPRLIDPVRALLQATHLPWVIENVEGAPLPRQSDLLGRHGAMLCGTSFGLRIYRHRLFETSFPVAGLPCSHVRPAMNPHWSVSREEMWQEFGRDHPIELHWRREMGIEWMTRQEAREAVPPAYTEHVGHHLIDALRAKELADAA